MLKSWVRRALRPLATYRAYSAPSAVGGWSGWYELAEHVVAFKDNAGRISYRW